MVTFVNEGERWRKIVEFPDYEVSTFGRVRRIGAKRFLRQAPRPGRYPHLRVELRKGGRLYWRTVHVLVLIAFVGPPEPGKETACHNDGNPANNRLDNLRWDTQKANMEDMVRHGTRISGERCHFAKITEEVVVRIRQVVGKSTREIGREFGISQSTVSMIRTRRIWKHV